MEGRVSTLDCMEGRVCTLDCVYGRKGEYTRLYVWKEG